VSCLPTSLQQCCPNKFQEAFAPSPSSPVHWGPDWLFLSSLVTLPFGKTLPSPPPSPTEATECVLSCVKFQPRV
jgi:hypothetical protein